MSAVPKDAPTQSQLAAGARAERIVGWSLRLFGGIDLWATFAVFMPVAWMRIGHQWCGLGAFPEGPLPVYLSRSTALLWAFHGGLLWFLATDVVRHTEVIRFVACVTIVAGVVLIGIDLTAGIPWWWTALEGPIFAASGAWVLWWLRLVTIFVD